MKVQVPRVTGWEVKHATQAWHGALHGRRSPRLQQQNSPFVYLRQTGRHHTARCASTHYAREGEEEEEKEEEREEATLEEGQKGMRLVTVCAFSVP